MAYSTSSPPALIAQGIGGYGRIWQYQSTDAQTDVDAAGYFTNASDLGLTTYDHVIAVDTDASPKASSIHMMNSTTDLNNGVAVTATDSD